MLHFRVLQINCSLVGGLIGVIGGKKVEVTDLLQMVALFHSLVGAAAVVMCIANYMAEHAHLATDPAAGVMKTALFLGTYIGGVTFTGSLVTFGKLQGKELTRSCSAHGVGDGVGVMVSYEFAYHLKYFQSPLTNCFETFHTCSPSCLQPLYYPEFLISNASYINNCLLFH